MINYNIRFIKSVFIAFYTLLTGLPLLSMSQTLAPAVMTGTSSGGEFYYYSGTTLSTGFSFTASPGKSLHIYHTAPPDCQTLSFQPSNTQNYIVTYVVRDPLVTNPGDPSLSSCQVMPTVQYFDGLGRPSQTVSVKGSSNGYDVITPITYDAYGREAVKYLPYTSGSTVSGQYHGNAVSEQNSFYQLQEQGYKNITTPFAQTVLEQSPLSRVLEQGFPGDPWQPGGNTVKTAYSSNDVNEVLLWKINSGGNGAFWNAYYSQGQLSKIVSTDENGNQSIQYKDKQGNIICKKQQSGASTYLSTYYIFNDYGDLAYVVPPIPSSTAYPTNFSEGDAVFQKYIYAYHYDSSNRLSEKRIPSKGWEYTVYNALDQVVATQDALQNSSGKWTFSKYDGIGRVIMTGEIIDSRDHQSITNAIALQAQNWETRDNSTNGYTTSNSFPTTWNQLYTVNYYDDYTYPGAVTYSATASDVSYLTTGLLTGTKVMNLVSGSMLLSINYYDNKGRLRESIAQNHLSGNDRLVNEYNFSDQLTKSTRIHNSSKQSNLVIINQYSYDHAGRKIQTIQQTGSSNNPVVLSQEEYNEMGQLYKKHLHSVNNGSSFLQDIVYTYNERGWLNSTIAPLFALKLNYNSGAAPQFNGNISSQYWGTANNLNNHYDYTYDVLNRITAGNSSTGNSENGIDYDDLGNIKHLNRSGGQYTGNYTYNYNGNQLTSVNGLTGSGTYDYYINGNMKTDGRNGTNIIYNYLNLPQTVSGNGHNIIYSYTASGEKLSRQSTLTGNTDYINGIVFDGPTMFIQTEEGRAIQTGTNFNYEYSLTDNLGNARVIFDTDLGYARQTQIADYYPFGLEYSSNTFISPKNDYLYNKKEKQEELNQYDYGARFYDPVIARWTTVDPLAEISRRWTPYNYGENNPIKNVDPDGMQVSFGGGINDGDLYYGDDAKEKFKELQQRDAAVQKKNSKVSLSAKEQIKLGLRNYGGDYSGDWWDNTLGAVDAINQINPIAGLWDAYYGYTQGTDRFGNPQSQFDVNLGFAMSIIPLSSELKGVEGYLVKVTSSVKTDAKLLKLAKETFEGNEGLRREANALIEQLSKGNMNPGIGSKNIGNGIFEARSRGGARVYFRNVSKNAVDIVGYSNKANQQTVIDRILTVFQ